MTPSSSARGDVRSIGPPRATPRRLPLTTSRGIVYVVDDEPNVLRSIGDLLSGQYEVHRFATGEDALAGLERVWPDVVLLDVLLPGLDGVEVCRKMKQRAGDVPLPVVLITALDSTADRVRGITAGADDFLTKPVHQSELRARVANLVQVGRYHALLRAERDKAAADARDLRAQLHEAERLATLGTFGAGVSHELNNIATVLAATVDALDAGELATHEAVRHLRHATKHVKHLAQEVLKAARPQSPVAEEVDLLAVAREVEAMTRITGRTKYIHVELLAPETPLRVYVPPVQAQQVVLNLLVNSADAISEQGRVDGHVRIELRGDGQWVELALADDGPGIPPEVQARLFEPFFTTKPPGLGTGLGLPVVKQLVEGWGGSIDVDSTPGRGTTVRIRVPTQRPA
ncbi:MAG: hybrid sensor histidine kinase/response regulator [Myxococcota bacterium]